MTPADFPPPAIRPSEVIRVIQASRGDFKVPNTVIDEDCPVPTIEEVREAIKKVNTAAEATRDHPKSGKFRIK